MSLYVSTNRKQQLRSRDPRLTREGLPGDEWQNLNRAQRRDYLESHFRHAGNTSRSYQPRTTAYQDAGLYQEQRLDISAVRLGTRAALGPSFDPVDEDTHERSRRREQDYSRSRGWTDVPRSTAMPQKYRDEYNRIFNADNISEQAVADRTFNAAWRIHEPLDPRDHYRGEPSTHSRRPRTAAPTPRVESAPIGAGAYQETYGRGSRSSKFSGWDEDSVYEVPRASKFYRLFRR
ncbi:hypothetical protein CC86DRAFT_177940 [Ophiobolus disseminans]|uniref:Uncharacterized protein n=1 Tax=Ophiobolus disseminans TaxID=1469910 RepID=A0A6A7A9W8_9PLEO|nr:hypothetical protein CC86DRAFT_177940 [Ophiobolus disseminans]